MDLYQKNCFPNCVIRDFDGWQFVLLLKSRISSKICWRKVANTQYSHTELYIFVQKVLLKKIERKQPDIIHKRPSSLALSNHQYNSHCYKVEHSFNSSMEAQNACASSVFPRSRQCVHLTSNNALCWSEVCIGLFPKVYLPSCKKKKNQYNSHCKKVESSFNSLMKAQSVCASSILHSNWKCVKVGIGTIRVVYLSSDILHVEPV